MNIIHIPVKIFFQIIIGLYKRIRWIQGLDGFIKPFLIAIEQLIDSEDFTDVNEEFERAYNELDEIARKKSGIGKGKDAKKAMKSLELVMDLLRDLLAVKYKLQENAKKTEKK